MQKEYKSTKLTKVTNNNNCNPKFNHLVKLNKTLIQKKKIKKHFRKIELRLKFKHHQKNSNHNNLKYKIIIKQKEKSTNNRGILVEISGHKNSACVLRLERAWSFKEGSFSVSIASMAFPELTTVAIFEYLKVLDLFCATLVDLGEAVSPTASQLWFLFTVKIYPL